MTRVLLDSRLLERIDRVRANTPRQRWVTIAVERRLRQAEPTDDPLAHVLARARELQADLAELVSYARLEFEGVAAVELARVEAVLSEARDRIEGAS